MLTFEIKTDNIKIIKYKKNVILLFYLLSYINRIRMYIGYVKNIYQLYNIHIYASENT